MELLDIVDESGEPTGVVAERGEVHARGVLHRTSHVWLLRRRNGRAEVLLQHRCATKESCPSCYDISSAGHIPAGCGFVESALRELREELGVVATAEELIYCGRRRFRYDRMERSGEYIDNQISNIYALWRDVEASALHIQRSELDGVMWMPFDECVEAVATNSIRHCIVPEELEILRRGAGL